MKTQKRILILAISFMCGATLLLGQSIEQAMTRKNPSCRDIFINAMQVIPALYTEKSFDSLDKALKIWENVCGDAIPVQSTRMLLKIEKSGFHLSSDANAYTIDMLTEYANYFQKKDNLSTIGSENNPEIIFFKFSSSWANDLLKEKRLDDNEKFICRILNGEIKKPEREIRQNAQIYPELKALLDQNFEVKRKEVRSNFAFGTGVWLPTGNLSTLGAHPTFSFLFGIREKHHALDLSMYIRYLNSANTYTIKKNDISYSTDYYLGFYFGLDYTYYFLSNKRTELGLVGGMGWDGFQFAEEPYHYDYYYYDYSHSTLNSFNANAGLRFNYFFSNSFYLGLLGRYNAINYTTHGGTNLSGDAVSIDLIIGFNGKIVAK